MARGGRRQGKPGTSYSNRTDLNQPVQATKGGEYGSGVAQERAQQAMPLQNAAGVTARMAPPEAPPVLPGGLGAFSRPTERPNEALTAGSPYGAGPGAEALVPGTMTQAASDRLRQIYATFPNEGLRQIIEELDS